MARSTESETCKECGVLVVDRRAHRRWHNLVVTCDGDLPRSVRYVGQDPEREDAD